MADQKNPDLKKFIEDPSFQTDRDLIRGYMTHVLTEEQAAVNARREKGEAPVSVFDTLFGWFGKKADDGDDNIFDNTFSFRRRK